MVSSSRHVSSNPRPKIHVVMVDYLKGQQLVEAVSYLFRSDFKQGQLSLSIIDNSESAENAQVLDALKGKENIDLQISNKNIGYTRACNLGTRYRDSV